MRARRWLHRHVWTRTGWRWAYSPSSHMVDLFRLGAPSFALLVQGELTGYQRAIQDAVNESLDNLEKATAGHTPPGGTYSTGLAPHTPKRLTMGLVELGRAGMVLPVGDHACPDTSCRKCWEPAPW